MYTQQYQQTSPNSASKMIDPKAEVARRTSELNVSRMTQKYLDAEETNAPNKEMLRNFAEITYTLHMVNMEMLEIRDLFHVLDDSLSIMDDCFHGFEQLMADHMYSGKSARQTKRDIKRFTKGIKKKVKNMFAMLKSVSVISGTLSKALSGLRSPKLFGKGKKKAGSGATPFDTYVAQCRAKQAGGATPPANGTAPATGAAPSGDVSDISDITGGI